MLGLALSFLPASEKTMAERLIRVQNELFQAGSELATVPGAKNSCLFVGSDDIQRLEQEIDEMEAALEPLRNFILPGGSSAGASLHLARTIVRRAERECVDLTTQESLRPEVIQYLNRLSDYLFVAARFVNHSLKTGETKWIPAKA